ncbi:MAG: hypothetical protein Q7J03_00285 [Methanoregula sp.]|nr:hypothetical protein [Methanoregula sp.]
MKGSRYAWMMVWLVFSLAIITPVASALVENTDIPPSTGPLDKDNPELISVLKTHTAYVGVMQQARMDGVIAYIDQISDGTGTTNLRWIQDDYLSAASSISLMYTSDEITAAREEMRAQSIRFSDETKAKIAAFNGNDADLRASANATENEAEINFVRMPDSVWLRKGGARLAAFNASAEKRAVLLHTLARNGVDIDEASKLSDEIEAKRAELQVVVVKNKEGTVLSLNSGIAKLNSQFRSIVDESLKNHEIQLTATAIMAMK